MPSQVCRCFKATREPLGEGRNRASECERINYLDRVLISVRRAHLRLLPLRQLSAMEWRSQSQTFLLNLPRNPYLRSRHPRRRRRPDPAHKPPRLSHGMFHLQHPLDPPIARPTSSSVSQALLALPSSNERRRKRRLRLRPTSQPKSPRRPKLLPSYPTSLDSRSSQRKLLIPSRSSREIHPVRLAVIATRHAHRCPRLLCLHLPTQVRRRPLRNFGMLRSKA